MFYGLHGIEKTLCLGKELFPDFERIVNFNDRTKEARPLMTDEKDSG